MAGHSGWGERDSLRPSITLPIPQRPMQSTRTIYCPACAHEFEVHGIGPIGQPKSSAYRALHSRGLTSTEIAQTTGLSTTRITRALRGERSFPIELWSDLAHRFNAEYANEIRYQAFIDRRQRRGQSTARPTQLAHLTLWDVGLTTPQLAYHLNIDSRLIDKQLAGSAPFSQEPRDTIAGFAGGDILNELLEGRKPDWW